MTEQAQNYLLKTIEEPPENVVFVLSLDNKQKLLPTIRSRCLEVQLEAQPRQEIFEEMLQSGAAEEQAAYAAAWSGGSPAQARQILADEQLADIRSHAEAIAVRLSTKRNPSMYLMEQDFLAAGKRMPEMLYALASLFADAALWPCETEVLKNPVVKRQSRCSTEFYIVQLQRIMELLNQRCGRKLRFPQLRDDLMLKSLIFDILEVKA